MFRAVYDKHREKNKTHSVAITHVANKMCQVIFAGLKNQKAYQPILA